jgi:hypothetical protein
MYNYGMFSNLTDPNYREEMEYHYQQNPTRRERAEATVTKARGIADRVIGTGSGIIDAFRGPSQPRRDYREPPRQPQRRQEPGPVRSAFTRPMQDPLISRIASGSGFGGIGSGPSRGRAPPPPPSRGTVIVTTCDEYGNCKTKKVSGGESKPRAPRKRGFTGILGGDDPGFRF